MKIVYNKENLLIIDDFFDNFDDLNTDKFFDKSNYKTGYSFPREHSHFIIDQYTPTPELRLLGEEAVNLIKPLSNNFPSEYSIQCGAHEIKWHGKNGLGAIPPHSDRGHYCGITICLNRTWDRAWGGWNYTFESDNIKTTEPKFNRAIIIFAPNLHGVTPVWETDKVRRTFQFFVDDIDD